MTADPAAADVAAWMLEELSREGILYQEQAVWQIIERFGDQFAYHNDHGNLAISKAVLATFRKDSGDNIVWVRSERCWRKRESWDLPGRQQD